PAGGIERALRGWSWSLLLRPTAPKEEPRRPARRFPKERNRRRPESRAHPAAFRYAARAGRTPPGSIQKQAARARRRLFRAGRAFHRQSIRHLADLLREFPRLARYARDALDYRFF